MVEVRRGQRSQGWPVALNVALPTPAHLPSLNVPLTHPPTTHPPAQAWSIVTQAYVDDSFNGTQWDEELVAALGQAADAASPDAARAALPEMLGKLGDPFTRWMPQKCAPLAALRQCLPSGGCLLSRRQAGLAGAGRFEARSHVCPLTPNHTNLPPPCRSSTAGSTRSFESAPTAA